MARPRRGGLESFHVKPFSYHDVILADAPIAYYRLDDTTTTAVDRVAGRNGILSGASYRQQNPGLLFGNSSWATSFAGQLATAQLPAFTLGDGPFSVECWTMRNAISGPTGDSILSLSNGLQLFFSASDGSSPGVAAKDVVTCSKATVGPFMHSSLSVIDTTISHHIVATKNAGAYQLFLDGVDVTVNDGNKTLTDGFNANCWISSDFGTALYGNHILQSIALYNYAMPIARAQAHYAAATGVVGATFKSRPTVVVLPATGVTSNSITLNGTVNPNGSATTYRFEYGTDTSYGTNVPTPDVTVGSDNSPHTFAQTVAVSAGVLYHYRIVGTNPTGSTASPDITVQSGGNAPLVVLNAATAVTNSTATLNGTVNPNGSATTYYFEYGLTTAYGTSIPIPDGPVGSDNTAHTVAASLSGLASNTTYHFRLWATNPYGITVSNIDQTFMTAGVSSSYSSIISAEPGLVAYYRLNESSGTVATDSKSTYTGIFLGGITHSQTGLIRGDADKATLFDGASGTIQLPSYALGSGPMSFEIWIKRGALSTVGSQPTMFTSDNGLTVVFSASDAPEGPDRILVRQGATGTTANSSVAVADTTSIHHIVATTTGSDAGLIYLDGVDVTVATGAGGIANGIYGNSWIASRANIRWCNSVIDEVAIYNVVLSPTQIANHYAVGGPPRPIVALTPATPGATSAVLNGTVNPNGSVTTYHFEYGLTTAYGSSTAELSVGSDSTVHSLSQTVSATAGTTYFYRIVATNASGVTYSASGTYTTSGGVPKVSAQPATSVTNTTATLNATVNPTGTATTYHFEYGTTTAYGTSIPTETTVGSDNSVHALSQPITGLTLGTTYHYRIVATNTYGSAPSFDQPFLTTGGVARNASVWPFTSNSIWNMPIGSNAVYSQFRATTNASGGEHALPGIRPPGIVLGSNGYPTGAYVNTNSGVDTNYVVQASASDPLRTVYQQQSWGPGRGSGTALAAQYQGGPTPWKIHLPDSFVVPDVTAAGGTPNYSCAVVQPDGTMFHFNVVCRPVAGADDFHATPMWQFAYIYPPDLTKDASIYSTGIYGGHGGSGMSAYGGALMYGEATGNVPIHHALSLDLNGAEYLYFDYATLGHVWPAPVNDGGAYLSDYYGGYHGHYKFLRMGSLLAVPPNVTEQSLGLTLKSTKLIFHAMQDYGVYIVDDTGWSSVDLNMDNRAANEFYSYYGYGLNAGEPGAPWGGTQPLWNELWAIYGTLTCISNNGPNSIGGGGSPRVPYAPPLAGP